ncbi:MAG: hypothetical protein R3Y32_07115 [Bacillota bacterium]
MNLEEMQNMMKMAENMKGKSPLEVMAEQNPQLAEMKNVFNNPADMLFKMSGFGGGENISKMGNIGGLDIASVVKMAGGMGGFGGGNQRKNSAGVHKKYYGLSPISEIASPEIIYALNKYLSTF